MDDPYQVLGVEQKATEDAIRSAFRKLAKLHHPDLNPGNKQAEERFKTINAAYSLLSDPEKRARFDRGEIDASGTEKPPERPYYRDFGDAGGRTKYRSAESGGLGAEDLEDILRHTFGQRQAWDFPMRGADLHFTLTVPLLDAVNGATRRIVLPDGRHLDVAIPAGFAAGGVLRLAGQGMPGSDGGRPGDALIEVAITPHPLFRRDGKDIIVTVPITLQEAVLGAKVAVPTVKGPVAVTVPPNSSSGTRLRLKGRGISGGHQFVELAIKLPAREEPELKAFLEGWTPQHPLNPRDGMEGL